jgi:hypothetical protein
MLDLLDVEGRYVEKRGIAFESRRINLGGAREERWGERSRRTVRSDGARAEQGRRDEDAGAHGQGAGRVPTKATRSAALGLRFAVRPALGQRMIRSLLHRLTHGESPREVVRALKIERPSSARRGSNGQWNNPRADTRKSPSMGSPALPKPRQQRGFAREDPIQLSR